MTKSENSTTCSHFSFAKIQPSEDADADPDSYALEKFKLYETRALKSPNWLFGSRKPEESGSATKPGADDSEKGVTSSERVNDFCNLDWLSEPNDHEEYIFQSCIKSLLALYMYLSITSTNEANGWYGRMVVLSSVTKMKTAKSTDIMLNSFHFFVIRFMEPFDNDHELEQNSAEVLCMNTVDVMDIEEEEEETEMEKALNEYAQIGSSLGIIQTLQILRRRSLLAIQMARRR
ncbi:unnamed protein product [Brassica napus]|uniref:(rape) hypothetical protein n=1 Tax=Brassica napus TaxID=3708 RepID=A0A816PA71_BRANA|nr:unnamed protein product [Brassica napus]